MGIVTELQFNGPYQEMYAVLFNAITDAINMVEMKDIAAAKQRLKTAQRDAEEIFLLWEEREEQS